MPSSRNAFAHVLRGALSGVVGQQERQREEAARQEELRQLILREVLKQQGRVDLETMRESGRVERQEDRQEHDLDKSKQRDRRQRGKERRARRQKAFDNPADLTDAVIASFAGPVRARLTEARGQAQEREREQEVFKSGLSRDRQIAVERERERLRGGRSDTERVLRTSDGFKAAIERELASLTSTSSAEFMADRDEALAEARRRAAKAEFGIDPVEAGITYSSNTELYIKLKALFSARSLIDLPE